MKVLMLNGSPNPHGCTDAALNEVAGALAKRGVGTDVVWLGNRGMRECIACGTCRKIGKCAVDDQVNAIAARLEDYDGLIVGSPVYYAGPTATLTAFLDRLFYSAGGKLANKPGACVVSCRRGGAAATFDRLNKYFTINNMPLVSSNYWNQVHGSRAEDVARDEEGMQTMRNLGENMAWLLNCIAAGRDAGVPAPEREAKIKTDFIR